VQRNLCNAIFALWTPGKAPPTTRWACAATGLAERLGESSGATRYHLRQLEKHGFVREVEGKGTGRERERTPGGINVGSEEATISPAGRSAATTIFRQMR